MKMTTQRLMILIVYLSSARFLRFDAHGTDYSYPDYARLSQRCTLVCMANKQNSYRYPFTTPGSRDNCR